METVKFYRISDGRIWDISNACYTETFDEESTVSLHSDGRPGDESYLKRTLVFYGYPIGDELKTDEERAEEAREKRDQLLAETDYLLMPDYPISEEALAALKTYRQALRDVPEQTGFPNTIGWPSKPEVIL